MRGREKKKEEIQTKKKILCFLLKKKRRFQKGNTTRGWNGKKGKSKNRPSTQRPAEKGGGKEKAVICASKRKSIFSSAF